MRAEKEIAEERNDNGSTNLIMCAQIRTADGGWEVYSEDCLTPRLTEKFFPS